MKLFLNIALILLALSALILGYLLMYKTSENAEWDPMAAEQISGDAEIQEEQKQEQIEADGKITFEEIAALTPPGTSATEAQIEAYMALLARIDIETQEFAIGNECSITPTVVKALADKEIAVTNEDTVSHTLTFNGNDRVDFAAGETSVLPSEIFMNGPGVYGYQCDEGSLAGLVVLSS